MRSRRMGRWLNLTPCIIMAVLGAIVSVLALRQGTTLGYGMAAGFAFFSIGGLSEILLDKARGQDGK